MSLVSERQKYIVVSIYTTLKCNTLQSLSEKVSIVRSFGALKVNILFMQKVCLN